MNITRQQRQKFRAMRFAKHLVKFVDTHRFPSFVLTDAMAMSEAKRQSHGERGLTPAELTLTEPLRDAQRWKEVTIAGLQEEMAEWQRNGWGWGYPILHELAHYTKNDWILKKAYIEIWRNWAWWRKK